MYCPTCKKNTITRFGPYGSTSICNWHFACQRLDGGCGYWRESNNPFAIRFFRAIGLEGKQYKRENPPEEVDVKEKQKEWLKFAGIDHIEPSSEEKEALEILDKEFV